MDFYGSKITVEWEGPENPIQFMTRLLSQARAYAGREMQKAITFQRIAENLAKNHLDKPTQATKESDKAFKARLAKWEAHKLEMESVKRTSESAKEFFDRRQKLQENLKELVKILDNTYPDTSLNLFPGSNYSSEAKDENYKIPSPWMAYSKKNKKGRFETVNPNTVELASTTFNTDPKED